MKKVILVLSFLLITNGVCNAKPRHGHYGAPPPPPHEYDTSFYSKHGDNIYGSKGVFYKEQGDLILGSDSSYYVKNNGVIYGKNGTFYKEEGNLIYGSDGTICAKVNNSVSCKKF